MTSRTADDWFAAYGVCHQHATNKLIHWICVPAIMLSILGLFWEVPVPAALADVAPWFHWTHLLIALALLFYVKLSPSLAIGMTLVCGLMLVAIIGWEQLGLGPVWIASLVIFVVAWIVQFVGHRIEGAKPAFFEDLQFLLIGPIWLLGSLYRKLGIGY